MFNYASKDDLKDTTGVDASNLVAKSDLVSLGEEVNKIDAGKVKAVPVDLYELRDVVAMILIKRMYVMN